jgi:hypothetical protein
MAARADDKARPTVGVIELDFFMLGGDLSACGGRGRAAS